MFDELLLCSRMSDIERHITRMGRVREATHAAASPPVGAPAPQRAPAGRRALRLVTELYGSGQKAGADPALFDRLAWSGLDGD